MIHPLRRRHRWITMALAVGLPIAFIAGLAVRKPIPTTENAPSALMAPPDIVFSQLLFDKSDLWANLKITTRLYADQQPARQLAVELHPQDDLKAPDLLVYWHPEPAVQTEQLPDEAYLLGALAGTQMGRFILPAPALTQEGSLILYSLAHQKIIATTTLPARQFMERIAP